ncbi:MAG: anthranilate phosphoribosyltransferase [Actinomycetota bacterium]|nr:anthranilate phosphoribosyltransferase [Actinomycetota bacterium]
MPESPKTFWPSILSHLISGQHLSTEEAAAAMRTIMEGNATPGQIGGFLMALRTKGETVDELEGLASTALEFARPVHVAEPVLDTCGTGGDRSGTFNISTVSALVVAGSGVVVAKHGNRAASSTCGSADLLEAFGVRIDLEPEDVEHCLRDAGIAFMFAPVFHPAAAHAAGVRSELRVPTVFNFLGPLTNPARPHAQVIGVSDPEMLPLVADVVARRGIRAKVFRGEDGLDELTTTGLSTIYEVAGGEVRETSLDPSTLGLARVPGDRLTGGDVARNVAIAEAVLSGEEGPHRDVVLLNAAAGLQVAGRAGSMEEGLELAARSIDSGDARGALDRWIGISQAVGSGQ